eukprot:CAMPEP_0172365898 /NCGR_PEP_ID=MMETSP1060-20121228/12306_1 /TAXON_ID=37318 /ORGANISM="Pseudo-nitzschia pungens, Strain cf. cingulata" /LENGTH=514 /DNA_ID=CAMNT_0013089485 /DNA_START=221 /DNA_END=1765 /DNA_ORIENTATION=+
MNARNNLDNTRSARVLLPLLLIAGSRLNNADAFQPSSTRACTLPSTTASSSNSQLQAVPPLHELSATTSLDPQELSTHAHALHGFLQHHSTNMFLSDAAAATLDSVTSSNPLEGIEGVLQNSETALENFEATEAALVADEGWWKAYLNIFKTTIEFVHSGIDGPVHSLGWEGGTWGFSIAIFTAGVRSLLVPLSFQQSRTTELTKALKPYVDEINTKFKDNENRKNQLVGKLYEDANQNPLSGCLLSLLQLPIFLGLYRGVRLLALDGKLDEPFLWIPSLQGPVTAETDFRGLDWLTKGWTEIDGLWTPSLGWETTLAFCIMPVVLVLGQKLTMEALAPPEQPDDTMDAEAKESLERTKTVLKFLPLLIGFFSLQVPAGLTIYWFTSNFFTLSQALVVRKYYEQNPPKIELPEYWDALSEDEEQMTPEERRAAAKAGVAKGPSLDDWVTNSKFHTVVERDTKSLRLDSASWKKLEGKLVVPAEFQSWVGEPVNGSSSGDSPVEATKEAEAQPQA